MSGFPQHATLGDLYSPAMMITKQDEADCYFDRLVVHLMSLPPHHSRQATETMVRVNLAYWAGYYGNDVRERVERLFYCSHPIFGAIVEKGAPTNKEALELGIAMGQAFRDMKP